VPDAGVAREILVQSMDCGNSENQTRRDENHSVCLVTVCVLSVVRINFLINFMNISVRDTLYISRITNNKIENIY